MSFILNVQNVQHSVCSYAAEQELICFFFLLGVILSILGYTLGCTPLGVVENLCNWLKTVQHQPERIAAELPPSKKKKEKKRKEKKNHYMGNVG